MTPTGQKTLKQKNKDLCRGKLRPFVFASYESIRNRYLEVNLEVNSLFAGQFGGQFAVWRSGILDALRQGKLQDPWISLFEATIHEHTQPKYTEGSSIFQFWCDFDGSMPRPRNDPLKEARRTYSPNLQANSLFGGQFGGQFPVQEANLWLQANCRASA